MALYSKVSLIGAASILASQSVQAESSSSLIKTKVDQSLQQLLHKSEFQNLSRLPSKKSRMQQARVNNLAQQSSKMFTDVYMNAFAGNGEGKFMSIGQQVADQEAVTQNLATTDALMNAVIEHREAQKLNVDNQKYDKNKAITETLATSDELKNALKKDQSENQFKPIDHNKDIIAPKEGMTGSFNEAAPENTLFATGAAMSYTISVPHSVLDAPTPVFVSNKPQEPETFDSLMEKATQVETGEDPHATMPSPPPAPKIEIKEEAAPKVEIKEAAPTAPTPNAVVQQPEQKQEAPKAPEPVKKETAPPAKSSSTLNIEHSDMSSFTETTATAESKAKKVLTHEEEDEQAIKAAEHGVHKIGGDNISLSQGFKVPLTNEDGAGYVGTIYIGQNEQPAKVLFDTGSDYLALTSDLCLDPKLGKQELDEPVFDLATFMYKPSGKDHRKCKSTAYTSKESKSAKAMGEDEKLDYGSAKLAGKLYQDKTCIDQEKTSCTNFEFLALYQAIGLDDTDGVLGLAVHPDKERRNLSYVWQLKNKGIIDKALVSFSISGPNIEDESYAQFGGINTEQIVGGLGGLRTMQTASYRPDWTNSVKQWALEGQNLQYGGEDCHLIGEKMNFPAIIDTGSSNIGVPEASFKFLKEKWKNDVSALDCVIDDNFCQVMEPCTEVAKKVKPISLQISGQVFEMEPSLYLHQAEGMRCQFAIHANELKGSTGNLFLVGDLLLRHLYQVYDFENETIALGINKHSQGLIQMHGPETAITF